MYELVELKVESWTISVLTKSRTERRKSDWRLSSANLSVSSRDSVMADP